MNKLCLSSCIFLPRGNILNDNFGSRSGQVIGELDPPSQIITDPDPDWKKGFGPGGIRIRIRNTVFKALRTFRKEKAKPPP